MAKNNSISKEEAAIVVALLYNEEIILTKKVNTFLIEKNELVVKKVSTNSYIYKRGKAFPVKIRQFVTQPKLKVKTLVYLLSMWTGDNVFFNTMKKYSELREIKRVALVKRHKGRPISLLPYSKRSCNNARTRINSFLDFQIKCDLDGLRDILSENLEFTGGDLYSNY